MRKHKKNNKQTTNKQTTNKTNKQQTKQQTTKQQTTKQQTTTKQINIITNKMSDNMQQTNQPHMASSAFPNEETENMKDILEIISTFVSEYISSGVVCKAVNITSPVLAIISNVYALFNMSHTIIKTSTVIATLGIHIVHLINMLLETFNIKASIKHITQYVHEIIIEQITPTMNKHISNLKNVKPNNYVEHVSTFMSWLKPVLATIMLAIGFIIPKFDINEWCKALNTRITAGLS